MCGMIEKNGKPENKEKIIMMKLGMIRYYDAASFDAVKNLGLEFIESCRNNDEESIDFVNHVSDIKANIARTGIPIRSVGRWNAECNVGGKIDEDRFKIVTDLFDAAVEVGAPVFVCGCNYDKSISLFKNYAAAIELFGRLLDRAKASGTKIAVYNCDWNNFVCNDAAYKIVLGELPELMLKFDASHAYNRGEDYMGIISNWGDRFAHVHIKGTVHAGRHGVDDPPAGMDDIKWGSVFATLYARKYDGGLSIEPHSSTWSGELGEKGVKYTIDFIRPFIL